MQAYTVCFFLNATLHDGITQPPGCQTTSAMDDFVDKKWAFGDSLSLGFFLQKSDALFMLGDVSQNWQKKRPFFAFSLANFFLHVAVISKWIELQVPDWSNMEANSE